MIRRRNYPYGYAPPAGHCDGKTYQNACFDEVFEETGLKVLNVAPVSRVVQNPRPNKCRRGGKFHYWQILEFDQRQKPEMVFSGELRPEPGGTEWVGWMTREELWSLSCKTCAYLYNLNLAGFLQDPVLVTEVKETIEKRWRQSPGIEVEWFRMFEELRII